MPEGSAVDISERESMTKRSITCIYRTFPQKPQNICIYRKTCGTYIGWAQMSNETRLAERMPEIQHPSFAGGGNVCNKYCRPIYKCKKSESPIMRKN